MASIKLNKASYNADIVSNMTLDEFIHIHPDTNLDELKTAYDLCLTAVGKTRRGKNPSKSSDLITKEKDGEE